MRRAFHRETYRQWMLTVAVMMAISLWVGCGGIDDLGHACPEGDPVISTLSPEKTSAGGPGFTLQIKGQKFASSALVLWNGSAAGISVTVPDDTTINAQIPANLIQSSGNVPVKVQNTCNGDKKFSNEMTFAIEAPAMTISTTTLPAGTVDATYSAPALQATGGTTPYTWSVDAGSAAPLPAGLNLGASTGQITGTPTTAGTSSVTFRVEDSSNPHNVAVKALSIAINNPAPTIASLNPSSATAGDAAFTLTVNGTGFVSSSSVEWDGSARTTTFVSKTQLTAEISASDVANIGTAAVTVSNPTPGGGTSSPRNFQTLAPSGPGVIALVSQGLGGLRARNSANGRYVAFEFGSTIYVRDTCLSAAPGCNPHSVKVSIASDGTAADGASTLPAISSDGRFVAFGSNATNLTTPAPPAGAQQIYVHDRDADGDGIFDETAAGARKTTLLSVDQSGAADSIGARWPDISADGRFVTFETTAALDPADGNGQYDIYVRDTCHGDASCAPATRRISVKANGTEGAKPSLQAAISANGRYVAFASSAALASGGRNTFDVYVRDRDVDGNGVYDETNTSGAIDKTDTLLVSLASSGGPIPPCGFGTGDAHLPAISGDGRVVAFLSNCPTIVSGDTNFQNDVFIHDRDIDGNGVFDEAGQIATLRVSVDSDGNQGSGGGVSNNAAPSVSADGRLIAFASRDTNLVSGDSNSFSDAFVYDRDADADGILDEPGAVATIRVSVRQDGTEGNQDSGDNGPSLSPEGDTVAFDSLATSLFTPDNTGSDIFLSQTGVTLAAPNKP